jgi:integrase
MKPPRVTVVRKASERFLQLRYRDRIGGLELTKSSGTTVMREAEREAARWEAELASGSCVKVGRADWETFLDRYEKEHLGSLADASASRATWVLERFRKDMRPGFISGITAQTVSRFQAGLRRSGIAETTIASMLSTLRAALSWAVSVGMLGAVPRFPVIRRARTGAKAKMMKGSPLSDCQFKAMLEAVPGVVGEVKAEHWRYYLRGLWWSGLRLEESIQLWWDRDDRLSVDFSGRRPMLRIAGEHEKGHRDRLLAMAPEFAEFLTETPKAKRHGPVFELPREKAPGERPSKWWVSRVICDIGKASGVVVDSRSGKHASAHDLRRSFGERWARMVMPQVLMELMRHESIETTMRYYVGRNAETTADILWEARKG